MRIHKTILNLAVFLSTGWVSVGTAVAAISVAEMPSRVMLSGVPEEKVGLRLIDAPVTSIALATSAKQLAAAASNSKYAQPKETGLAAILGIKSPPARGSADRKSTRLNSSHPRLSRMPSSA